MKKLVPFETPQDLKWEKVIWSLIYFAKGFKDFPLFRRRKLIKKLEYLGREWFCSLFFVFLKEYEVLYSFPFSLFVFFLLFLKKRKSSWLRKWWMRNAYVKILLLCLFFFESIILTNFLEILKRGHAISEGTSLRGVTFCFITSNWEKKIKFVSKDKKNTIILT